jgi:hypothetical protein
VIARCVEVGSGLDSGYAYLQLFPNNHNRSQSGFYHSCLVYSGSISSEVLLLGCSAGSFVAGSLDTMQAVSIDLVVDQ